MKKIILIATTVAAGIWICAMLFLGIRDQSRTSASSENDSAIHVSKSKGKQSPSSPTKTTSLEDDRFPGQGDTIEIIPQIRPGNSWPEAQPGALRVQSVEFLLFGKWKLTSVKAFRAQALASNENPRPVWHLISDSSSIPSKGFFYGQGIQGMKPAVPGARPGSLQPDVDYVLMLEAGTAKGQTKFHTRAVAAEFGPPNGFVMPAPRPAFKMGAIPPRDPQAKPELLDLTELYNGTLTQAWHFGANTPLASSLRELHEGIQTLDGIQFDIRGIVQLHGQRMRLPFPTNVTGIQMGLLCRKLHFLHATGWVVPDGTQIGSYVLHYSDGQTSSIPIIYGEDLREWHGRTDKTDLITNGQLAWHLPNDRQKRRLFHSTRENPRPEVKIENVDFISAETDCFPFLIAITAEP